MPLPFFRLCAPLSAAEPEGAGGKSGNFGTTSAAPWVVILTHGHPDSTTAAAAQGGQAFMPSPPPTLTGDNCQSHPPGASCGKAGSGLAEQDVQGKGWLVQGRA